MYNFYSYPLVPNPNARIDSSLDSHILCLVESVAMIRDPDAGIGRLVGGVGFEEYRFPNTPLERRSGETGSQERAR